MASIFPHCCIASISGRTYIRQTDAQDSVACDMQVLPAGACFAAVVLGLFIIEVVGSPLGRPLLTMPAQQIVIILAALGSGACVLMSLAIPRMTHRMSSRGPAMKVLKRMNLLGLVCDVFVRLCAECVNQVLPAIHACLSAHGSPCPCSGTMVCRGNMVCSENTVCICFACILATLLGRNCADAEQSRLSV